MLLATVLSLLKPHTEQLQFPLNQEYYRLSANHLLAYRFLGQSLWPMEVLLYLITKYSGTIIVVAQILQPMFFYQAQHQTLSASQRTLVYSQVTSINLRLKLTITLVIVISQASYQLWLQVNLVSRLLQLRVK